MHRQTRGSLFNGKVIGVGIPGAGGAGKFYGDIVAVAVESAEGGGEILPGGDILHIDGGHLLEGGNIVGVGHHAHLEHRRVAGAAGTCPEGQLQGVDGEERGVDTGQNNKFVVGVGTHSGAAVPIQVAGAAVGSGAANVGIAEILGAVVDVVPAGNLGTYGGGSRGKVFKAV